MQEQDVVLQPKQSLEAIIERCQAKGLRISRQRRYILELLWQSQEHLSARAIYNRLTQQGRDIGHTSVYQNLEVLSEHGMIECLDRSDGRLYGHVSDTHSHVNCTDTSEIIDIRVELPPALIQKVEAETGIKITDYRIDFFGQRHA